MLTYALIQILILALLSEAITEVVVKSEMFKPVRNLISKLGSWPEKLFSCGYCFSMWSAGAVVLVAGTSYPITGMPLVDLGVMSLVVHRLSNFIHNFNDKYLDKYYDVRYVNTEKE